MDLSEDKPLHSMEERERMCVCVCEREKEFHPKRTVGQIEDLCKAALTPHSFTLVSSALNEMRNPRKGVFAGREPLNASGTLMHA